MQAVTQWCSRVECEARAGQEQGKVKRTGRSGISSLRLRTLGVKLESGQVVQSHSTETIPFPTCTHIRVLVVRADAGARRLRKSSLVENQRQT